MLFLFSVEVYHYSVSYEWNWGLTITTQNDTADLVNETPQKTTCTSFFKRKLPLHLKEQFQLPMYEDCCNENNYVILLFSIIRTIYRSNMNKIIVLFYLVLKSHFKVLKSIPQFMTVKMSIKFNTFILLVAGGID